MSSILSSRNMADEDLQEIMGGKHYDFDGDLSDAIKADLGSGRDEAFALPSAVEDEESESEEEEVENDSEEEEEDGEETYDNEFDTDNEGTCTTLLFAFAFTFVFQVGFIVHMELWSYSHNACTFLPLQLVRNNTSRSNPTLMLPLASKRMRGKATTTTKEVCTGWFLSLIFCLRTCPRLQASPVFVYVLYAAGDDDEEEEEEEDDEEAEIEIGDEDTDEEEGMFAVIVAGAGGSCV